MRPRTAVIGMMLSVLLACPAMAQQPGFSAGTELLYLRPSFSNNPAYLRLAPTCGCNEFDWSFERAHSFWAGYTLPSGWGVRFDAFLFDGDSDKPHLELDSPGGVTTPLTAGSFGIASPSAVLAVGLGQDRMWFRSHLRLLRTEYEGTYSFWEDDWSAQLSAGLRYQLIGQNYSTDLSNTGDGRTMENLALRTSREFVGLGPTLGLFGSYRVDGPWSVYGKFRGAVLFGTEDRQFLLSGILLDPDLVIGSRSRRFWGSRRSQVDRVIPVTEAELGVEYSTDLGPLNVALRGGVVAQTYFDTRGAAGGNGALSLLGGQVSVAIRY